MGERPPLTCPQNRNAKEIIMGIKIAPQHKLDPSEIDAFYYLTGGTRPHCTAGEVSQTAAHIWHRVWPISKRDTPDVWTQALLRRCRLYSRFDCCTKTDFLKAFGSWWDLFVGNPSASVLRIVEEQRVGGRTNTEVAAQWAEFMEGQQDVDVDLKESDKMDFYESDDSVNVYPIWTHEEPDVKSRTGQEMGKMGFDWGNANRPVGQMAWLHNFRTRVAKATPLAAEIPPSHKTPVDEEGTAEDLLLGFSMAMQDIGRPPLDGLNVSADYIYRLQRFEAWSVVKISSDGVKFPIIDSLIGCLRDLNVRILRELAIAPVALSSGLLFITMRARTEQCVLQGLNTYFVGRDEERSAEIASCYGRLGALFEYVFESLDFVEEIVASFTKAGVEHVNALRSLMTIFSNYVEALSENNHLLSKRLKLARYAARRGAVDGEPRNLIGYVLERLLDDCMLADIHRPVDVARPFSRVQLALWDDYITRNEDDSEFQDKETAEWTEEQIDVVALHEQANEKTLANLRSYPGFPGENANTWAATICDYATGTAIQPWSGAINIRSGNQQFEKELNPKPKDYWKYLSRARSGNYTRGNVIVKHPDPEGGDLLSRMQSAAASSDTAQRKSRKHKLTAETCAPPSRLPGMREYRGRGERKGWTKEQTSEEGRRKPRAKEQTSKEGEESDESDEEEETETESESED